ncbi:hypothetical protein BCR42DRAFT_153949 [Absidia repens]|uniref:Uncharacterized protein n=1 Tax=Absidia repens TaxID=90262 RepID=A0A1X2I0Z3_9FUNG|nr:hypothetical protein BCR42DRAFT_153949 [Absidia repens]
MTHNELGTDDMSFQLLIRQQPLQSRVCGVGEKGKATSFLLVPFFFFWSVTPATLNYFIIILKKNHHHHHQWIEDPLTHHS